MNRFTKALAIDTAIELIREQRKQTERNNVMFVQHGLVDFDLSNESNCDKNFDSLLNALCEIKDDVMGAV
ncbi:MULTISPECIES: hypothetical protein [Vibrio]|uniref:hypothetical protein n=1 Tax=Vibrio TaxID=662 RepID=UPI000B5CD0F5|nr:MULTISPECIES: hypothetical protein [Vibrio]HBV77629.1 hypothetical protein [Vibrio sp.]